MLGEYDFSTLFFTIKKRNTLLNIFNFLLSTRINLTKESTLLKCMSDKKDENYWRNL